MKGIIEYFKSYNDEVMKSYNNWVRKHRLGYYVIGPMVFIGSTYALWKYLCKNNKR